MPTGDIGKLTQLGQPLFNVEHSNCDLISFPRGLHIENISGEVIGAIIVFSGSSFENDHLVSEAGKGVL